MTKILNFSLKIKGVVGRVAHAKSSDPATPPKIWNVHIVTQRINLFIFRLTQQCCSPKRHVMPSSFVVTFFWIIKNAALAG